MASSIHIQKSVPGSIGHNSRENFSYSVVFTDEKNELDNFQDDAYKIFRSELKERTKKYTERTGQKLQKNAVTQLSAVINLEQHHTLKDLKPIAAELEKKFDTKVFQMSIHRDEGKLVSKEDMSELYSGKDFFLNTKDNELYFDKKFSRKIDMNDYEVVKNYHAHIEMMGLDSDGKAIRQKMNKVVLQQIQTSTAATLKMQRGKETKSYTKDQMKEITDVVGKKSDYESTTLYSKKFNEIAQDLGYYHEKKKRKDTHKFKNDGAERESVKREMSYDFREMQKKITSLENASTQEKKELHKLNSQVKNDKATIQELHSKILEHQKEKQEVVKALKVPYTRLSKEKQEVPDNAIKFISFVDEEMNNQKTLINSLKTQNNDLREELVQKEIKINSTAKQLTLKSNTIKILDSKNQVLESKLQKAENFIFNIAKELGCENSYKSIALAFDKTMEHAKKHIDRVKNLISKSQEMQSKAVNLEDVKKANNPYEKDYNSIPGTVEEKDNSKYIANILKKSNLQQER